MKHTGTVDLDQLLDDRAVAGTSHHATGNTQVAVKP